MEPIAYWLALGFVAIAALGRVTGIVVLKLRQAHYARRAVAYPRSWRDLCTAPEPYLLAITTVALALQHGASEVGMLLPSGGRLSRPPRSREAGQ